MQSALHRSAGTAALELRMRQQSGAHASTALPAPASRLARRAACPQPPGHSRGGRGWSRRGRLSITAAIKKSQEKHVVCHKTVVAKPDQARSPSCQRTSFPSAAAHRLQGERLCLTRHLQCRIRRPCAQAEKVAEMCKDVVDFSQGRASLRSNGIMDFKVIVDQSEPNVFYFWERYDGNASMGRHNTCPELKAFMENVRACCPRFTATPTLCPSSVPSSVRLPSSAPLVDLRVNEARLCNRAICTWPA